ncbi:hypothetical protein ES703_115279 [subsurface metagenome]
MSFANTSIAAISVSSCVLALSFLALGGSLTAVTVIDTVAASLWAVSSLTLKVKLSDPLKFGFGV